MLDQIEPDEALGDLSTSEVRAMRQFWEKPWFARPAPSRGRSPVESSVLVAKVATLVQTGWQALPELSDGLAHIEPFVGTPAEADAVRQAYELMARANFSKSVMERCPDALRFPAPAHRLVRSGSPHRVMKSSPACGSPESAKTLAPSG